MSTGFTIVGIWLGFFVILALLTLLLRWLMDQPRIGKAKVRKSGCQTAND